MNITLTNFKYIKSLSKETEAFSASVIIDGKLAGTVSNHGHGGANMYNPFGLKTTLDEYAKTLPPIKNKYFPDELMHDSDTFIGEIVADLLMQKDLAKLLTNKILFVKNNQLFSTKKLTATQKDNLLADKTYLEKNADSKILNLMSLTDAFKLYKECTS